MPARASFDYAIVRVVPRVEREEFINVGVIVFCRTRRFLGARVGLDKRRLTSLSPEVDQVAIQRHLDCIPLICAGGEDAGPIGQLAMPARFHWLVSPRSTIIQMSPVHSGLCTDPGDMLEHLFETMVGIPLPRQSTEQ